jgi:hypothetical protein
MKLKWDCRNRSTEESQEWESPGWIAVLTDRGGDGFYEPISEGSAGFDGEVYRL